MKRRDNIKRLKALGKELSAKPKISGNGNKAKTKPVREEPKLEENEMENLIDSIEKED